MGDLTHACIVLVLALTLGCGGGCGGTSGPSETGSPRVERAIARPGLVEVGVAHVLGASVREQDAGGTTTLDAPLFAPLVGKLSRNAARSPDGRWLLYATWTAAAGLDASRLRPGDLIGTPSLRLRDERTGDEVVVAGGGDSFAWRGDGALAYGEALVPAYRASLPYRGHIYVRASSSASPTRWTTDPARYVVVGWAGKRLVAYRRPHGERLDVLVFDGPGRARLVSDDASIVAIEPSGERMLISRSEPARVEVLETATGAVVGSLDLGAVGPVAYGGDWVNDLVVAAGNEKLVIFRLHDAIALEQVLDFGAGAFRSGGIGSPRFLDDAGERVAAVATVVEPLSRKQVEGGMGEADAQGASFVVACERRTVECRRGQDVAPRTWIEVLTSERGEG